MENNLPLTIKNLYDKFGGKCVDCGKQISPEESVAKHTVLLVDGGKTELSNLTLKCVECSKIFSRLPEYGRRPKRIKESLFNRKDSENYE